MVEHSEIVLSGQAVLQLTFDPGAFGHTPVTTRCQLDHPFYVKNRGGTDDDENTRSVQNNIIWTSSHSVLLSFRLVVILPEPDRGASWDNVL